jgi:Spy/CpxP family protein refolding chaperone
MRWMPAASALLPLAAAILAAVAQAQAPPAPAPGDPFAHYYSSPTVAALRQVDLSDAQKQAVRQIVEGHQEELRGLYQSQGQLRRSLARADPRAPDYDAQVGDIAQQAAALAAQRVQLAARLKSQIYGTLTEGQKIQLTTVLSTPRKEPEPPPPPPE